MHVHSPGPTAVINRLPLGAIHVNDVRLWAHVGVLDHERREGQWFSL
ncbi:MAG: dihydroneopterin aldolase, partial [Cyanobacteriota bacterium]|nr:dihydroneopterin aldolase [Cyanobacteriota bacterium]